MKLLTEEEILKKAEHLNWTYDTFGQVNEKDKVLFGILSNGHYMRIVIDAKEHYIDEFKTMHDLIVDEIETEKVHIQLDIFGQLVLPDKLDIPVGYKQLYFKELFD